MIPTESELLLVARVVRAHGLRGEMKIAEQPGASGAWRSVAEVFIGRAPEDVACFGLERVRPGGKLPIMSLVNLSTVDQARGLAGQAIFVRRRDLPKPEDGSYYVDDLIGLRVEDGAGRELGALKEIFSNGAHEIYVVKGAAGEILLPVIEGVVESLDLDAGTMVVKPPDGLLD